MKIGHLLPCGIGLCAIASALALGIQSCEKPVLSGTRTTAPVSQVIVTPSSMTEPVGQAGQLTATPEDSAGNTLSGRTVTWSSSDATVASVNGGLVGGIAVGTATISATSEGQSGTASITVTPIPVASVTVTPAAASVAQGATAQLTATPKDANGNALSGRTITWASSNPGVATVSGIGLVNGVSLGSATITATSEGKNGSASMTVTGVPVASVSVSPATAGVQQGATVQLTASAQDANGNPLTGRVITWASSSTSIATVTGTGVVTGVAGGSATITATSEGKSGTASVTVTAVPVASVAVTPPTASVAQAGTVQLTATPRDANGNPLTGRVITWTSGSTSIATVSATGVVAGVAAGSVTITATSEGKSGTASVTVTAVPVASVAVTPPTASVAPAGTVQLTATPRDANGNPLTGRTVTWASGNTAVASVNGSGLVTGVAVGSATITATSEGQSGMAAVTVTAPGSTVVLVGAGDIAECGSDTDDSTAALIGRAGAQAVFTVGDNAYPDGYYQDYANCWAPSWGRYQAIVHPAAGNHEYHDDPSSGGGDYYTYFYRDHGTFVGDSNKYYYSYDLGAWHMVVLNSLDGFIDMSTGSPEEQWLRADLAANTKRCILAYMHYPRFSSGGDHGSYSAVQPLWQALYDYGADLAMAGHDHEYERFAPQAPDGTADPVRGIRSFVVGTGGGGLYFFATPLPNSEVRNASTWGVLKFTLGDGTYSWQFIPITGQTFTDSGSGTCHH